MTASGKLGNAFVFTSWKGIAAVRSWVMPVNRMSGKQGDNRLIVGGIGRAVSKVGKNSVYYGKLVTLNKIPNGQSKQSALVKAIKTLNMVNATAFEAVYTAFNAHTAKTDFIAKAVALGLTDFTVSYKLTQHTFSAGMMLYLLAKYGVDMAFGSAPYTTALASWTTTQINLLATDLAAVA
jgi:hypothetical protein